MKSLPQNLGERGLQFGADGLVSGFPTFFSAAKPLMQIKSYPEPRYVRQLQGELFCLRTCSPACLAPPSSPPQGLLRQPLGNFRALPSSLKTTGLVCPEQARDPTPTPTACHRPALSFWCQHTHHRPSGACSLPRPL